MIFKFRQVAPLAFASFAVLAGSAFAADTVNSSVPSAEDRITSQVVDAIANDSRLSGRVGVEIDRGVVTLTGRLADPMQVEWAEGDALSVTQVMDVNNEIKATLGDF